MRAGSIAVQTGQSELVRRITIDRWTDVQRNIGSDAVSPSLIQHEEEKAEVIIITARKSLKRHFLFLFQDGE